MWKEEDSCNDTEYKEVDLCISAGDINWHIGTIGIEVKLNPWHASNYAMICMRYSKKNSNETQIYIRSNRTDIVFESQVFLGNKKIYIGLDEEFEEAIEEFFKERPDQSLPAGIIEILYGGYDKVGSSKMAFKKAMNLLVFIFQNIDEMDIDILKEKLFKLV